MKQSSHAPTLTVFKGNLDVYSNNSCLNTLVLVPFACGQGLVALAANLSQPWICLIPQIVERRFKKD